MANYRKSFNFRSGLQVDNDNFIINENGLVGIGTSVPTQFLDVRGNLDGAVNVIGLTTTTLLSVASTSNFYGDVNIGSNITLNQSTGVVTAVRFVGDASGLQNIVAIATAGWIVSGDFLSTSRSIGINTTSPDYLLQVGENPSTSTGVGIGSLGEIYASGSITSGSGFVGSLTGTATTATNLSNGANITAGTIDDARLPNLITSDVNSTGISTFGAIKLGSTIQMSGATGIITAVAFSGPITGEVTGNAESASKLLNSRNFSINGDVNASAVSFDGTGNVVLNTTLSSDFNANTSGIITASEFDGSLKNATIVDSTFVNAGIGTFNSVDSTNIESNYVNAGIGTFDQLTITDTTTTGIDVISNLNSFVSLGVSERFGNESVELVYTNSSGQFAINNYDLGGVSINLHEGTGLGITEGFNVKYENFKLFDVTYDGKVGVNRGGATLERNFEVGGTAYISESARIVGVLTVGQGANQVTLGDGSSLPVSFAQNFNTTSGISTFNNFELSGYLDVSNNLNVGSDLFVEGSYLGVGTDSNNAFKPSINVQVYGKTYVTSSVITGSELAISASADGSLLEDPRTIPNELGSVVPYMEYGGFQVEVGAASIISENFLIVPKPAVAVVGFGSTNLGLAPSNYNTNKYLSKVGINTYFARSIFDVGTGSTTMNSYFIPPSLTQDEIDIVANLWQASSGIGTEQARKVTPDGIVPGALVYNKTTDKLQIRSTSSTFTDLVSAGAGTSSVLSTPETASGSTVSFTDVPSWATSITVMFLGVSMSGTDHILIQLGTGPSTWFTSGYVATSQTESGVNSSSTSGFIIRNTGAADEYHGKMVICKFSDNQYVEDGSFRTNTTQGVHAYGSLTYGSGTIDRLRIVSEVSDTFDSGEINVLYT